jgi:hypothetical protein
MVRSAEVANWRGGLGRVWTRVTSRFRRRPSVPAVVVEAPWDGPTDARSRLSGRLAAAGGRLRSEADRLRGERAYGHFDLGAHARLAGQGRAHRARLRRFRSGNREGASAEQPPAVQAAP